MTKQVVSPLLLLPSLLALLCRRKSDTCLLQLAPVHVCRPQVLAMLRFGTRKGYVRKLPMVVSLLYRTKATPTHLGGLDSALTALW